MNYSRTNFPTNLIKLKTGKYKKIAICVAILILGFFSSQMIAKADYSKSMKELEQNRIEFEKKYAESVAQKSVAYPLVRRALEQLKAKEITLAIINLKKATDLEPNYRDAWLLLSYAQLELGAPKDALKSAQKAERIDPVYAKTYELISSIYATLDDEQNVQKAKEKSEKMK